MTLPFAVPLPVRNSTFSLQRGEPLGHDSPLPLLDGTAQSKSATRFPGGLSEQEKKLGPLLRPGEHVIGGKLKERWSPGGVLKSLGPTLFLSYVGASGNITNACTDLAGFSSPHPKAKAPRAEKKFREMPNGPYKKPNPVVRLWHQITGKKEEEPYLEVKGAHVSPLEPSANFDSGSFFRVQSIERRGRTLRMRVFPRYPELLNKNTF